MKNIICQYFHFIAALIYKYAITIDNATLKIHKV